MTNQTSRFPFDVISLNVKGLRNSIKRKVVFNWLNDHTSDHCVYFLQEIHSIKGDEKLWMKELKCDQIYFSHGENNAQGTFIGLSMNFEYKVDSEYSNDRGRFVVLKCIIQDSDSPFSLVSIYNANNETEQVSVIESIRSTIDALDPDHSYNIVLGGDFNFIQDTVLDSDGRKSSLKTSSIAASVQVQNARDLVDIWRSRNSHVKRFTFRQKSPFFQRRLDYFSNFQLLARSC